MYGNLSICIILSVLSSILFRVGYAYCIPAAASISRLRIPSQATRNRMSKFAVAKSTNSHFTHAPLSQKIVLENGISASESPKELSFVVYGEPMPLQRHRVLRSGITYNPSSKLQNEFLQACTGALPDKPMEGPLEVRVVFYFKRPLNHFGTGKNKSVLKKGMDFWHSKRKGEIVVHESSFRMQIVFTDWWPLILPYNDSLYTQTSTTSPSSCWMRSTRKPTWTTDKCLSSALPSCMRTHSLG